ncbi:MAG: PHP domain-containing protein [Deltaproteobacteria bacterium]|nr:PHP domain-containing protein [Deltaproteobacteria bacterium]
MATSAHSKLVIMLDLHTHSSASDGTLSPKELVQLAKKIKLRAVGLCDHDTTGGLDEAMRTARQIDQLLIPGVELSANCRRTTVHIVGLCIHHECEPLQRLLEQTRRMRDERNPRIIAALQQEGIDISMDDVTQLAVGNAVGRPHFAAALIQKGVVKTAVQAFDTYLGANGRAYVARERLDAKDAIQIIRTAGGVPILAHPHQTGLAEDALLKLVGQMKEQGLLGIEVFCSGYTSSMSAQYTRVARRHGLVRSGGSDFHGAAKPNIRLGRGIGNLYVRDDLLEPILALAK